ISIMKIKLLTLAAAMCVTALAGAHTLTIDGAAVNKTVATITFDGDKAILTFGDASSSTHDLESVKLDFRSTSSLTDLSVGTLSVTVGSSIVVSGVAEGTLMQVYDMRGVLLKAQSADASECTVSLEGLDAGVYIFRAGNEVVKFVKR
ncbi:MAG: T9SS type A sorting domain-containing protein, partial [Duncaniella sp.]|nr:T9SS type A sorting domain-containing protein [Duncaniella sp.]